MKKVILFTFTLVSLGFVVNAQHSNANSNAFEGKKYEVTVFGLNKTFYTDKVRPNGNGLIVGDNGAIVKDGVRGEGFGNGNGNGPAERVVYFGTLNQAWYENGEGWHIDCDNGNGRCAVVRNNGRAKFF